MSNPFMALDLSDDENITVVKPAAEPKVEKKPHVHPTRQAGEPFKTHQPRKEMQQEEENLRQKKKYPVQRGTQPQPDVPHPGERSKIGLKKEEHVNTHRQPSEGGRGRQYDRHSGTGRGREIKKGGAGGHNWGKAGEEVPAPAATPDAAAAGGEPAAEEAPIVEEDPTLTLEEYEKLKAQKRSGEAFQLKEVRKVSAEIKGTVYKKDEDLGEGDYIKLGEEHDLKKKPANFKHKEKKVFEIDFKVRDTSAPEPSFGARRGGRPEGSRGGGSFRSDRPARDGDAAGSSRPARGGGAPRGTGAPRGRPAGAPAPGAGGRIDTADQSAFPKLGA